MKKIKLVTVILASAMVLCFTSCSSMESDAKKLAKMHYELEQIGNNIGSTSNVYAGKAKEVFEFEAKTWNKYSKNIETKEQFQKILDEEMKKLMEK